MITIAHASYVIIFSARSKIVNIAHPVTLGVISGLAFEHGGGEYFAGDRLGVLLGSVLSAVIAYIILHFCLPKTATSGH